MTAFKGWKYPTWEQEDADFWLFKQDGKTVGEAYRRDDLIIKWHCKTSDWRSINAETIEQAKAECEASFWKDAWIREREKNEPALTR